MSQCAQCINTADAGLFCGFGLTAEAPKPCQRCGDLTRVVSRCGTQRHADCKPAGRRPRPATRTPAAFATPDESFTAWLQARGDLDYAGIRRAESLWREHMREIPWRGAHTTALNILNGAMHYQGIPPLPALNLDRLEILREGGAWNARSWLHTPADLPRQDGYDLTAWDVNGMYLSAAAIELGTGEPDLIRHATPAALQLPGWVRVTELHNAPWSIGSRWHPGMWMPTPLLSYARERGAVATTTEALVWPTHRRWLDPHVNLMRKARTALLEAAQTDRAALAVLDAVKGVYTRMFGGLLGSQKHNHGLALRPDWRAMIQATGQARMFRALDGIGSGWVVGFNVDAAWIVLPASAGKPEGLPTPADRGLGKFKPAGRCHWTRQLAELHADGEHDTIRKAVSG